MKKNLKRVLCLLLIITTLIIPISSFNADAGWHSSYGGGGSSHSSSSHSSHSSSSSNGPSRPMTKEDFKRFAIVFGSISFVLFSISMIIVISGIKKRSRYNSLKKSIEFKEGDDIDE